MFIVIFKLIIFVILAGILPSLSLVFYLSRDKGHIDLLDKLIMAILVSPLVLVLVSFLEEILGIPQSRSVITANLAALGLINIFLLVRYFRGKRFFSLNFSWDKLVFLLLFVLVILFRVLPTEALSTPLLHDPIAHSQWLKQLNLSHFTTRQNWYPQGLEYYLNYIATYFDLSYPKIVLTWTNLFSALFPLAFFYMGMLLVRKAGKYYLLYAMALFTLAAVSRVPTNLYFTAGKNSMIFALSATPIILYVIYASRSKLDYLIATMLLCSAIVIHYPTGFSLLVVYFTMSLLKMTSWREQRLKVDIQALYNFLPGVAALVAFGVVLAYRVLPIYSTHPPENDKSTAGVQSFINSFGVLKYVTDNFYLRTVSLLGTFTIVLFIAAVSVLLFAANGSEHRRFTGYFLSSFVALYLIGVFSLLPPNRVQGIFLGFQIQYFFVLVPIVVSAWFIGYIVSRGKPDALVHILAVFILAALVIHSGVNQYRTYLERQEGLQDRKSTRLNSSHIPLSRMPSSA